MSDADEQQLARRRRALAQRYGQQNEHPSMLHPEQENDVVRVLERAHEQGVGVHHSPDVTALLSTIAPDQQIPPPLCDAVASLIAWLQQLEEQSLDKQHEPNGKNK